LYHLFGLTATEFIGEGGKRSSHARGVPCVVVTLIRLLAFVSRSFSLRTVTETVSAAGTELTALIRNTLPSDATMTDE